MPELNCEHRAEGKDPDTGACPLCETVGSKADSQEDADPAPVTVKATEDAAPEPAPGAQVVPLTTLAQQSDEAEAGKEATPDANAVQGQTEEAEFFADLERVQNKQLVAILFFGFRTAGKTWLLERMKYELFYGDEDSIACEPPFKPIEDEKGKDLPGSSKIEFHRVLAPPRPYVLIDIPGEIAEELMEGKIGELRMLLAAMKYASAMIVALPSDTLFFGEWLPGSDAELLAPLRPRGRKAKAAKSRMPAGLRERLTKWAQDLRVQNARLEQFATGLHRAASIVSYLHQQGVDPADKARFDNVKLAEVVDFMADPSRTPIGGRDGLDCPTFFALTKADRVLGPLVDHDTDAVIQQHNKGIRESPEGQIFRSIAPQLGLTDEAAHALLAHPWEIVRATRQTLHRQLISAFPLGKFDYVTAFYGHEEGSTTITRDHYKRHPQKGVYEVLQWISEAQRLGGRKPWRRFPYILAARARRHLSGERRRPTIQMVKRGGR